MQVRVYQPVGGPARVVIPNPRLRERDEPDDVFLARIAAAAEAQDPTLLDLPAVDVPPSALPMDRDFRNAWRIETGQCRVNMPAAREIHRAHLRTARAPKLAELDALYLREVEKGPQGRPTDITAQKQVLRDLPADPAVEAASTPAALRATWPTSLLGTGPYTGGV